MNHDFDDELRRSAERRSRRNPRMKKTSEPIGGEEPRREDAAGRQPKELDILGDASVRPLPQRNRAQATGRPSGGGLLPQMEEQIAKRKRRRRMITMIVAECFALIFIFTYAAFAKKISQIQTPKFEESNVINNNIDVDTEERMKGYWTIAVFGVDSRDKAIAKGTNADVNMICNINLDTGEIKLVSVFRDSYMNISEGGSYNKINQAYFLGGPEQAVAALNRNLDLNMTSYMTFNWKAVADGINVLGGVDIELSKAEFYYINSFITETVKVTGIGSKQLTKAGMNHLDGVQAVAYGRLRLMDTDYARTERQRKIIAQAFEKAKKADLKTLNTLIGAVFPQVATNIGVDDLVKNATILNKFHIGETTGFPQARGDASMGKKGAVVVPQTLESNVASLHQFLFGVEGYNPSDTVKKLSARIAEDTGMYRAGKSVGDVGTGGGVIQPPKTSAAATKATDETDDDDEKSTEETTGKGHKGQTSEAETDEHGRPVEAETDEHGRPVEPETIKPGSTTESGVSRPGDPAESSPSRPGSTTESSAPRPGSTTESTAPRPGGNPESSASRPGGNSESTVSRPGSNTEHTTASTEGPVSSRPGEHETPTSIQQFPGSDTGGNKETIGNSGPGGQAGQESRGSGSGPVAAPGQ